MRESSEVDERGRKEPPSRMDFQSSEPTLDQSEEESARWETTIPRRYDRAVGPDSEKLRGRERGGEREGKEKKAIEGEKKKGKEGRKGGQLLLSFSLSPFRSSRLTSCYA